MLHKDVRSWLLQVVYGAAAIFVLYRLFFVVPLITQETVSYVAYPFIRLQHAIVCPIRHYFEHKKSMHELSDQVQKLQLENEDLQQQIFELHMKTIVFEEVDEIVDFAKRYEAADKRLAKVIMYLCNDVQQRLWIEGGSDEGITKDMIAVYKDNIVGRVCEVFPKYSVIMLLTDGQSKISGKMMQANHSGVVFGSNQENLSMNFVPHFATVTVDDTVVSNGQGLIFPQGFIIGKVVQADVQGVSYEIKIQPLIEYKQLNYIYLIASI